MERRSVDGRNGGAIGKGRKDMTEEAVNAKEEGQQKKDAKEEGQQLRQEYFDVVQLEFDTIRTKPGRKTRKTAQRRNEEGQGGDWRTWSNGCF